MSRFKPMLACREKPDLRKLNYPVMVSPKLDGIRCISTADNPALSRTLKEIPNRYVQETIREQIRLAGLADFPMLDGELVLFGEDGKPLPYDSINSAIMSRDGQPAYEYCVFDAPGLDMVFKDRYYALLDAYGYKDNPTSRVNVLVQKHLGDAAIVEEVAQTFLENGFEGAMIRDPKGPYKYGRSTMREGYLLKYKFWEDAEFQVINATELYRNENEPYKDEVGAQKRSTSQAGLVPAERLGSIICAMPGGGSFEVGTGFSDIQRYNLWLDHCNNNLVGRIAKIKFQGYGSQGRPRFPVFLGWRHEDDT